MSNLIEYFGHLKVKFNVEQYDAIQKFKKCTFFNKKNPYGMAEKNIFHFE